jgi:glycosyltransferase involved in cell wall biosynthesis
MRIAFVYDALFPYVKGGAERRYHELARRLAAEHDVHHVSWQWWDGPATTTADGVTLHGVGRPPVLYGSDGKRTVREAVAFARRLVPTLLQGRFDVIDCSATPYLPLYTAAAAARLTRTPLVATWHEFWGAHWREYLPARPVVARVAESLERRAATLGTATVAVSAFTQRRIGREASAGSWVVPNGIDTTLAADAAATPRGGRVDVAFVGRLIDEKRVDRLLDALALLASRGRTLRCAIVGDGPARDGLMAQSATLGLGEQVTFTGAIAEADVRAVLADAELFVTPSDREGFGISVIEAQLAGAVPIVVRGPHTAAPDLGRDGVDGVLCEPDAASLAAAIERHVARPEALASMRRAGRVAALRFDWDDIASQMLGVYESVRARDVALARAT